MLGNFCKPVITARYLNIYNSDLLFLISRAHVDISGELRFGTDESTFNAILVQRNMAQLRQIFQEYENITGHGIENAIENEFSGDIKKGLLAIGNFIKTTNDS
jgi:hypothetical protein